jgi:hypothetical protein
MMEILLVSPGGVQFVILSDAGGSAAPLGVNLTIASRKSAGDPCRHSLRTIAIRPTNGDSMRFFAIGRVTLVAITVAFAGQPAKSYGDNSFSVTVGSPFTIASAPPTFAFPTLHQTNGNPQDLMIAVWSAPDDWLNMNDRQQTTFDTQDGGQHWGQPNILSGIASGGHSSARLSDGTDLWLGFFTDATGDPKTVSASVGRSSNGHDYTWSAGNVTFPQNIAASTNPMIPLMMFARSIVELQADVLLATMYGEFEGDTGYRSVLVRSTDGGTTWNYYSTIAYNGNAPGEGYSEPVIERTANGHLLCVMRTDSYLPMQISRSIDDGLTWSAPAPLPGFETGVFPDLVQMSNGILALSYGRPDNHIMFSLDGNGETWTTPTTIYHPDPVPTCGYTSIEEIEPGRLLYIYSYLEDQVTSGAASSIRGVYIDAIVVPEDPGGFKVNFIGNPDAQYTIQFAPTLPVLPTLPDWQTLGLRTADPNGLFNYIDNPPAGTTQRFYRAIIP